MAVVATGELDLNLSPSSARQLEKDIGGVGAKAGTTAGQKLGAAIGAGAAALGAVKVFGSFLDEANEAAKIGRDTAAVIKSTGGAANVTAGDIEKLATKLSTLAGVDDDLIQANLNVLATFTSIKNVGPDKIFDQAALAAQNLAARMGGDLQGATVQVGKALNDPVKGITALSRVGVAFTKDQKAVIKSLVASGDILGAQKVILAELGTEFAGAAEANATDAAKLSVAFGNVKESLGTALLPIVQKVSEAFVNMSPGMQKLVVVGGLIAGLMVTLAPLFAVLLPILAGITVAGLATAVVFAGIGIAAAALAFIIIKNWDTIKNAIGTAFEFIKSVVGTGLRFLTDLFMNFPGAAFIIQHFDKIKGAANAVMEGIKTAFRTAFNFIKSMWNSTVGGFGIPGISIGPFKTPGFKIPRMHDGGVFQAPFGQREGLALLRNGERVLTPGQSAGNVFNVSVNFAGAVSEAQAYTVGQAVGRGAAYEMERAEARRTARVT